MLSKRLQAIYEMLPEVSSVLDVGTDHCLLPMQISKDNSVVEIGASDIAEGPLQMAANMLEKNKISNVSLYLSDGLVQIPKQYECIVIAGMGAINIIDIFEKGKDYLKGVKYLLLQCNKNDYDLRKWLGTNGYIFLEERIVFDYKYYPIMLVAKGREDYNEYDYIFGPILRKTKSESFCAYWKIEYEKNMRILRGLSTDNQKRFKLQSLCQQIELELATKNSI